MSKENVLDIFRNRAMAVGLAVSALALASCGNESPDVPEEVFTDATYQTDGTRRVESLDITDFCDPSTGTYMRRDPNFIFNTQRDVEAVNKPEAKRACLDGRLTAEDPTVYQEP